jgi:cobalt-zinc-cadmium efflux system outer membrane protein
LPTSSTNGGLRADASSDRSIWRFSEGRDAAFVAGVSMPIPIRYRNGGEIEAARAEALTTESALLIARLDADRARYDASIALQAAGAGLTVLASPNLQQAAEGVRLATIGCNVGRFTLIERLDAPAALTSARLDLIDARVERARAV